MNPFSTIIEQITRLRELNEKRSKGEWGVQLGDSLSMSHRIWADGQFIAYLSNEDYDYHEHPVGSEVSSKSSFNARFIAAAPEMLSIIETQHALLVMAKGALKSLSDMYGSAWDLTDGNLVMLKGSVPRFEESHEKGVKALTALAQAGLE